MIHEAVIVLDEIPFRLDRAKVLQRLHLAGDSQYAGEVDALVEAAEQVARPRAAYSVAFVQEVTDDAVVLATTPSPPPRKVEACARFASRALGRNLRDVERAFPYVATCGPELDTIALADHDVFAQFVHDTIKELLLWAALAHLYEHLIGSYGLETLASMNPGSGELQVWPIEQQRELFAFLGDVESSVGVALTESCLMVPNKSVSGLFYPCDDGFENCQLCRQEPCRNRRAPFDPGLWEQIFTAES